MGSKNEDLERVIKSTVDNLPSPFMVFGKKKEQNPLEDFWMSKLESIENQYNEHVVKLEKSLLGNRINQRRLLQKEEQLARVKSDLKEKSTKLQSLTKQSTTLQNKLSLQTYKTSSLSERLSKSEEIKSKVLKSLENERFERIKSERDIRTLKQRLENLERDKRFLFHEVSIKDSERKRVEEREGNLVQTKLNLIKNLTDIDQERRIQSQVNVQLVEDIGRLLHGTKSQDYNLLKQRTEIDLMLESMKQKQNEHEEVLRKLGIVQKSSKTAQEENKHGKEIRDHLDLQVRHWKEELSIQQTGNKAVEMEKKDLHRENSHLRCQLAELRQKLGRNESRLKSLEMNRRRTEIELRKAKEQAKSVQLLMCRNKLINDKLSRNKTLRGNTALKESLELLHKNPGISSRNNNKQTQTEIESYKKKIWQLERQKQELERNISDSRGKQNRLQLKMKRYNGIEQEVVWTQKAMGKLEGDRNRLENLLKSMALSAPNKIPFDKLVTDPSILDRVAKYQVLQKRLAQQTEMVEKLKMNAVKIFEYRKRQAEDKETDKRLEEAPWKLSHWKYSSEDTLADVNDMFDPMEGQQQPLSERKYYKEYLGYLDTEIPEIRKKIAILERKQHYTQQQKLDAELKAKNAAKRQESVDQEGISRGAIGGEILDIVPEDDEDDEDDDDNQDDDSDMGMLAVISTIDDDPEEEIQDPQPLEIIEDNKEDNGNGAGEETGSDDDDENESDNHDDDAVDEIPK